MLNNNPQNKNMHQNPQNYGGYNQSQKQAGWSNNPQYNQPNIQPNQIKGNLWN